MRTSLVAIAAVVAGIVAWEAVIPSGTRREAWDLPAYWQIAYPAMVASSFVLGWLSPRQPWRWGALVVMAQGVWSLAKWTQNFGLPNLLPLGLLMFAVLSLPCIGAAYAGAWLGRLHAP